MNQIPPKDNAERPEQILDETEAVLRAAQQSALAIAMRFGHGIEVVQALRPTVIALGNASTTDPRAAAVYTSAVNFMAAYRDEVSGINVSMAPIAKRTWDSSGSTIALAGTVNSTASIVLHTEVVPLPLNVQVEYESRNAGYDQRFSKLDSELGRTYQAIREARYGTSTAPERTAAPLLRQAYDHLFGILAPDEDVRRSPFWKEKTEPEPDEIWRAERLEYALAKHVGDRGSANTLRASAKHIRDVYQLLNKIVHERTAVDAGQARSALSEMQIFLENWIDAIGV